MGFGQTIHDVAVQSSLIVRLYHSLYQPADQGTVSLVQTHLSYYFHTEFIHCFHSCYHTNIKLSLFSFLYPSHFFGITPLVDFTSLWERRYVSQQSQWYPTILWRNPSKHYDIHRLNVQPAPEAALVFCYWCPHLHHWKQCNLTSRFALWFQDARQKWRGSKHPSYRWCERALRLVPGEVCISVGPIRFGVGPTSFWGCTREHPLRLWHSIH